MMKPTPGYSLNRSLDRFLRRGNQNANKQLEIMKQAGDSLPGMTKDDDGKVIDFGIIDDEAQYRRKRMVVKVCGRRIHNYRSERAMSHAGWFHFSIIAKDSDLYDAIRLCRHWDEFFELNILAIFLYFPASNWLSWVGDHFRSQLLQLVFLYISSARRM